MSLSALPTKRTRTDWIAFAALMASSCFIFLWNLDASGYANEFYSAAAQAGSVSWEAFLWGASDSGCAITVDKPPASIWLMALSVRLLGLSSFAILLPQALMGIACTGLLYAIVRRLWGNWAGIVAGALFELTPVAVLMFRFNNPDALLVLLMLASSACVLKALAYAGDKSGNRKRTAWLVLAGVLVGFGFLTKQLQVLLVLPGFAVALFAFSPTRPLRRAGDAVAALASAIVAAGWWILLTAIVPSGSRPYIGGSQTDSFLELTFNYNGLGRITGNETGSVVPGGSAQGGNWGETGINRLFTDGFNDQITWLALFAFAGIVVGIIAALVLKRHEQTAVTANSPLTMPEMRCNALTQNRLAFIAVFGCWLAVTWLVFSFMAGIFHQYYTVALSPAVAALAATCLAGLYELRSKPVAKPVAAALSAFTLVWSFFLIKKENGYEWLAWAVLAVGIIALAAALIIAIKNAGIARNAGAASKVAIALVAVAIMAGPVVWTAGTIQSGHQGSIVTAGPSTIMGGGSAPADDKPDDIDSVEGADADDLSGNAEDSAQGQPGGGGSFLGGGSSSEELATLLQDNASDCRWAAATTGSQSAAGYQLESGLAVMAIGGFNGSDPSPTLDQFKQYVEEGLIGYYIGGNEIGGTQMGGSDSANQIAEWVAENFEAQTIDGITVYNLRS